MKHLAPFFSRNYANFHLAEVLPAFIRFCRSVSRSEKEVATFTIKNLVAVSCYINRIDLVYELVHLTALREIIRIDSLRLCLSGEISRRGRPLADAHDQLSRTSGYELRVVALRQRQIYETRLKTFKIDPYLRRDLADLRVRIWLSIRQERRRLILRQHHRVNSSHHERIRKHSVQNAPVKLTRAGIKTRSKVQVLAIRIEDRHLRMRDAI